MPIIWLYALVSVVLVSLVSLVGIVSVTLGERTLRTMIFLTVSFATGGLFGDAFLHLLPEAYGHSDRPVMISMFVLGGIFLFFLLEKVLRWRHEHELRPNGALLHLGQMNLIADGIHNLIDGILIGASYLVSVPLGVTTTIAVILHEIPQEIGDFGVLLHAGFRRPMALWFNFVSASLAILGALIALMVGTGIEGFATIMTPLAAGGFIYIAGSDLVPELQKEDDPRRSLLQFLAMSGGVILMLCLLLLE
ncbi:MAG: ZIP family metal transporter [Kiritimatiellae bacterium]|nr:ZIP family metal transporter [Kiritimatiellia bacterium]